MRVLVVILLALAIGWAAPTALAVSCVCAVAFAVGALPVALLLWALGVLGALVRWTATDRWPGSS